MYRFFTNTTTIEDVKREYRELAQKHHPDHGGDTETMQALNDEFHRIVKDHVGDAFAEFKADRGYEAKGSVDEFAEILSKIIHFNITIEIIGYWIYAFDSFEAKDKLKELGFWFSKKHKAWVYSGGKKRRIRTRYTTDQVRAMHGSEMVREREERTAVSA